MWKLQQFLESGIWRPSAKKNIGHYTKIHDISNLIVHRLTSGESRHTPFSKHLKNSHQWIHISYASTTVTDTERADISFGNYVSKSPKFQLERTQTVFALVCTVVVLYCFVMCVCVCVCVCVWVCNGGCFGNMYTVLWLRVFLTWLRFFLPWLRFFRAFSSVVRQMPG